MADIIKIERSSGRGKYGQIYYYVRPAKPCANRSRRFRADKLEAGIKEHFPIVKYFAVGGALIIGAKDEGAALREFWRICQKDQIGKQFPIIEINL